MERARLFDASQRMGLRSEGGGGAIQGDRLPLRVSTLRDRGWRVLMFGTSLPLGSREGREGARTPKLTGSGLKVTVRLS